MKNEYIAAGGVVIAAIIGAVALYLSSGAPPASQHIEIRTDSHDQATNNTQIHITPSDPLDALTATFTRDKNPLTQIACTLACLPFPYDIQDSQDGTLEVYTWGTLGATIKGGTLIARDAGGRIIGRHEIAPGYASAPYDSTRLKVPGFRPAEVAKIDLTLRGSPDGFDNTVFAWSRSFLLETQGTSLSVKAISPIDVSVLDPGKG